jgi:hypothetical protein
LGTFVSRVYTPSHHDQERPTSCARNPYQVAKSLEQEQRLARLESSYAGLNGCIEIVEKRLAALQAQLDHLRHCYWADRSVAR